MTRRKHHWLLTLLVLLGSVSVVWAEAPSSSSDKTAQPSTPTPPSHKVKKTPFRITLELDGLFEAESASEIAVRPEEWSSLVVQSVVPHGVKVRKGEVLLTLDTEKIDRAIADLRADLAVSEATIKQNQQQLQALEKTTPLDLEASRRLARFAEEDQKYFMTVERPFTIKAAEFNLKSTEDYLEYQEEELRQLEKMYKADEITEETEEIVLRRARDAVQRAKFMVECARLNRDQVLKFSLPRMEESVKENAVRRSLEWEKDKVALPLAPEKQRLELEKQRLQRQRSEERLKQLLADRETLSVKSPIDGIVYYGKCVRGKFSDSTSMADNLRPKGSIMPNQVVMTVVRPRPIFIRASANEDQVHWLQPGVKGLATPTAYPKLKLKIAVDRISDVPTASGSFDARFSVSLDRTAKHIMPGMACKIKITPYLKKAVLTVPPKCVFTDELDDQQHYVYLLDKQGKPVRRDVELGEKSDKLVEIARGLAEGDQVLLEAPKEQD